MEQTPGQQSIRKVARGGTWAGGAGQGTGTASYPASFINQAHKPTINHSQAGEVEGGNGGSLSCLAE